MSNCGPKQVVHETLSKGARKGFAADPLNASYRIEGQEIQLVNGRSEVEAAPGSATKIRTLVFGNPVYGDLDGDGVEDSALLLVHDPGGSGTFYYAAASLRVDGRVQGLATLNRYFGQMVSDKYCTFRWEGPLGSTMMSGPENLMNQESAFLNALEKARSISIWDSRLVLQDDTGGSALEFGH